MRPGLFSLPDMGHIYVAPTTGMRETLPRGWADTQVRPLVKQTFSTPQERAIRRSPSNPKPGIPLSSHVYDFSRLRVNKRLWRFHADGHDLHPAVLLVANRSRVLAQKPERHLLLERGFFRLLAEQRDLIL